MISDSANYFDEGRILLFNKPVKWTSFDLVNKIRIMIRSTFGIRKIKAGHTGTLDPLADGLMIICTGKATKRIEEFMNAGKEYVATVRLGLTTPSFDLETETDGTWPTGHITKELVEEKLLGFLGETEQVPPLYSAKFVDGKRAYEFARKGLDVKLEPKKVTMSRIELLEYNMPELKIRIACSKGTYIRSFARDLGVALGSGAYLSALTRTSIGEYRVEDAYTLENFKLFLEQMKQT
jgi:tRNA pseudouridine55 synthase